MLQGRPHAWEWRQEIPNRVEPGQANAFSGDSQVATLRNLRSRGRAQPKYVVAEPEFYIHSNHLMRRKYFSPARAGLMGLFGSNKLCHAEIPSKNNSILFQCCCLNFSEARRRTSETILALPRILWGRAGMVQMLLMMEKSHFEIFLCIVL